MARGADRVAMANMREPRREDVHVSAIVDAVKKLCIDANLELEPDTAARLRPGADDRALAGRQARAAAS